MDAENLRNESLSLAKGMRLHNRYEIGDVLGIGGFGITYRGYDIYNEEICAVKELFIGDAVERGKDGTTVVPYSGKERLFQHGIHRFMEEAAILNQLKEINNVVRITDYFKENNTAYFVMEYIDGLTLKKLMKKRGGTIPFDEAQEIIVKVGTTLELIHSNYGIFHRDLSPENVLIRLDGEPKIIDFGNAKSYIRDAEKNMSIVLKPSFAPPEQYTGRGQGPWTDVYSLAGVFYFITSGERIPPSTERLAGAEYIPLCKLVPQCSLKISDAVDQGLVLDPQKRTQSVGQFVEGIGGTADSRKEQYEPYVALWSNGILREKWRLPSDVDIVAGRDQRRSNIVISGESQISKQHCVISYDKESNKFRVMDVSTNGAYVRGTRLVKERTYVIEPGTKIMLGKNICFLEMGVRRCGT
ncbi:MAG: protein kinase [Anaerovoracaceae bacterium]|nr:protein kinase [Anaerovoracaceae bacterium]